MKRCMSLARQTVTPLLRRIGCGARPDRTHAHHVEGPTPTIPGVPRCLSLVMSRHRRNESPACDLSCIDALHVCLREDNAVRSCYLTACNKRGYFCVALDRTMTSCVARQTNLWQMDLDPSSPGGFTVHEVSRYRIVGISVEKGVEAAAVHCWVLAFDAKSRQ